MCACDCFAVLLGSGDGGDSEGGSPTKKGGRHRRSMAFSEEVLRIATAIGGTPIAGAGSSGGSSSGGGGGGKGGGPSSSSNAFSVTSGGAGSTVVSTVELAEQPAEGAWKKARSRNVRALTIEEARARLKHVGSPSAAASRVEGKTSAAGGGGGGGGGGGAVGPGPGGDGASVGRARARSVPFACELLGWWWWWWWWWWWRWQWWWWRR